MVTERAGQRRRGAAHRPQPYSRLGATYRQPDSRSSQQGALRHGTPHLDPGDHSLGMRAERKPASHRESAPALSPRQPRASRFRLRPRLPGSGSENRARRRRRGGRWFVDPAVSDGGCDGFGRSRLLNHSSPRRSRQERPSSSSRAGRRSAASKRQVLGPQRQRPRRARWGHGQRVAPDRSRKG